MTQNHTIQQQLIDHATSMQQQALCFYSKFSVGAALRTADGTIIGGFNIESASYGLTMCAERVALFSALAQHHKNFTHMALVTHSMSFPCGACRQMIYEFCPHIEIIIATPTTLVRTITIQELLPFAFGNNDLTD